MACRDITAGHEVQAYGPKLGNERRTVWHVRCTHFVRIVGAGGIFDALAVGLP
ncbi:hypothetical protein D9M68_991140 [compost metagenome]